MFAIPPPLTNLALTHDSVWLTSEFKDEYQSLDICQRERYTYHLKRPELAVGDEDSEMLISPYPDFGNPAMVINDAEGTEEFANVHFLEVTYKGWPYLVRV